MYTHRETELPTLHPRRLYTWSIQQHLRDPTTTAPGPPARPTLSSLSPITDERRSTAISSKRPASKSLITRNGDEAKAMLKRRELPALVIANLSLPRLDGFALLAELKRVAPSNAPPVLVISSSKELSGAAWNLKERLGVTELLADRRRRSDDARDARAAAAGRARSTPARYTGRSRPSPGVVYERWIADTIDRIAADVARRFSIGLSRWSRC